VVHLTENGHALHKDDMYTCSSFISHNSHHIDMRHNKPMVSCYNTSMTPWNKFFRLVLNDIQLKVLVQVYS